VPKALVYSCAIVSTALLASALLLVVLARRSGPGQELQQGSSFVRGWHQFINGLRLMANTRTMLLVAAMSGLALFLNVLATWELMKACRILLPLVVAAAVLIITRVGTAIPATPGSVGAYQFFSVLGLGLFGVSKTAAAAFTLIAFGAFTFPPLLGGALAFVLPGADFTEIVSLTRRPSSQGVATEENEGSEPSRFTHLRFRRIPRLHLCICEIVSLLRSC
jgi:uncharacterized membrane protein YbhN (UPF0104 family)